MTLPQETTPRIAILGAGAVGSLVAARLVQSGLAPSLIARGARLEQLREKGLWLRENGAGAMHLPVRAASASEAGAQDIVFLALKAHAIEPALPDIARLVTPATIVVPLINGVPWWYFQGDGARTIRAVDPHGALARAFDPNRLVGAVLFLTASLDDDGAVLASGPERIVMGPVSTAPESCPSATLAPLRNALGATTLAVHLVEEVRRDLWSKIALNLATNPLSVVAQATLAEQFNDPALVPTVTTVLRETIALARRLGVEPRCDLDEMLAIGRAAGPFRTSMAQDHARGAPLELDAIARSVLELAETHEVAMPTARTITEVCSFLDGRSGRRTR